MPERLQIHQHSNKINWISVRNVRCRIVDPVNGSKPSGQPNPRLLISPVRTSNSASGPPTTRSFLSAHDTTPAPTAEPTVPHRGPHRNSTPQFNTLYAIEIEVYGVRTDWAIWTGSRYSLRKATIGSKPAARLAGTKIDTAATKTSKPTEPANTSGSCPFTWNSSFSTSRVRK